MRDGRAGYDEIWYCVLSPMPAGASARIYAVIRRIPRGRVATYGQVARLAGLAGHARQVGYALSAAPDDLDLPWHRVINAKGEVSRRAFAATHDQDDDARNQRRLLEQEGVIFDDRGRVSLQRFGWKPRR